MLTSPTVASVLQDHATLLSLSRHRVHYSRLKTDRAWQRVAASQRGPSIDPHITVAVVRDPEG